MRKLRVLDLFSGIGGFSLGLERTGGFETVAFCEIDPFCRRVLAKHWPEVPCHEDITRLDGAEYRGRVDVVCGGFPCQDISFAGAGAGLDGDRSGLFWEMRRVIGEVGPRLVILENVAALLSRGLGDVLGALDALGYDVEWHCIPAAAVGAPHRRDRVWIVGYARGAAGERDTGTVSGEKAQGGREWFVYGDLPYGSEHAGSSECARHVAYAEGDGCGQGRSRRASAHCEVREAPGPDVADANRIAPFGPAIARQQRRDWFPEPAVGRVADGVPQRMDRLRALGNAVVPQIPEIIGRAILQAEAAA